MPTEPIDIAINVVDNATRGITDIQAAIITLNQAVQLGKVVFQAFETAIKDVIGTTIDYGRSLKEIELQLGATAKQSAGLQLASDAVGVSMDLVTSRMMMLEKGLKTVNGTMGVGAKQLADLKINYKNADGTMMDSIKLLQSISNWFVKTTDVTARNNAEMTLFGRGGAAMDLLLTHLANGGMADYMNQAQAMGLVLSTDQTDKIEAVSESMNIMKDAIKGAEISIGYGLIPVLQKVVTWLEQVTVAAQPAFQYIGNILGLVTGGGGAPASSGPMGTPIPEGYKYKGTLNGPGTVSRYQNAAGNWLSGGVGGNATSMNGGVTNAPGPSLPGQGPVGQGHGDTSLPWMPSPALKTLGDSIKNFSDEMSKVNWTVIGTDLTTFGGWMLTAAEDIANASRIADQTKFIIENGGFGQLAGAIAGQLGTTILQLQLLLPMEAAVLFNNLMDTLRPKAISALEGLLTTAGDAVLGGMTSFGLSILHSVNAFLSLLHLPKIPIIMPAIPDKGDRDWKSSGGPFAGWGVIGDAPGGGLTPYSELVYAPGGAQVFKASDTRKMLGYAGGGYVPPPPNSTNYAGGWKAPMPGNTLGFGAHTPAYNAYWASQGINPYTDTKTSGGSAGQAISGVASASVTVAAAAVAISNSGKQTTTATQNAAAMAARGNSAVIQKLTNIESLLQRNFTNQSRQWAAAAAKIRK